ncbi:MAG: cell filamentation protein Fic [Herbinix sp.]|nr:cell filamentation protein Fic [Herbinix sp.]
MENKELFKVAEEYKEKILINDPQDEEKRKELHQYFRITLTHSSLALEGNTLCLTEIKDFLEDNLTVAGKTVKEYNEAAGHAQAFDYMMEQLRKEKFSITEELIKQLHYLYYNRINSNEAGRYRNQMPTGTKTGFTPPSPEELDHLMKHFINQMDTSQKIYHPIEYAAFCHKRIMDIQPFSEGNGCIARFLLNILLIRTGYGMVQITAAQRDRYLKSLTDMRKTMNPDIDSYINLIAESVIESQRDYCRMIGIE